MSNTLDDPNVFQKVGGHYPYQTLTHKRNHPEQKRPAKVA